MQKMTYEIPAISSVVDIEGAMNRGRKKKGKKGPKKPKGGGRAS